MGHDNSSLRSPPLAGEFPPPAGVNIVGFLRGELGLGEAARRMVAAVRHAGIPYAAVSYSRIPHRQDHPFETEEAARFPVNILSLNAEHLLQFVADGGRELLKRTASACLWFWESTEFPPFLEPALELVDEIWVTSDFVRGAISGKTTKPVRLFPLPVFVPAPPASGRGDLGLPEDAFVFLFVFDFFSTVARKNPLGLIDAFTRAFPSPGRARLYLKSINGHHFPREFEIVRDAVAGRPDILFVDGYLDNARMTALTAGCDCYVSLHRSEGFGLTIADAMALGKPTIATGFSGNMTFMDEESAYLVGYRLTTLDRQTGPYPPGTVWAEPDVDHAARLLRQVFEDPGAARARGEAGRRAIALRQSIDRAADFVKEHLPRLDRLGRVRRDRTASPGMLAARYLDQGPSISWDDPLGSGPLRRTLRRILRRVLNPYLLRQRELEELLVAGLEQLERSRDENQSARERVEDGLRQTQYLLAQLAGREEAAAADLGQAVTRLGRVSAQGKRLLESVKRVAADTDRMGTNLERVEAALGQLTAELYASPYMAEAPIDPAAPYASFEAVFRGPEDRVRELLVPYVALLRDCGSLVDLGCGRGELLELMMAAGVPARGIELDRGMVERCRAKGLQVEPGDAVEWLERQPVRSIGALTAIHVIEHLSPEQLQRLLTGAARVLRDGGLFVAETINPHSVQAFKTFWVDPTHRGPIFPEVARTLALIHGFRAARIIYPRGSGDPETDRTRATEYALVAEP